MSPTGPRSDPREDDPTAAEDMAKIIEHHDGPATVAEEGLPADDFDDLPTPPELRPALPAEPRRRG
jgi:hypothetical protein